MVIDVGRVRSSTGKIRELEAIGKLDVPFESIIKNLIHLHFNRLFIMSARAHEYVIFYMLSNYYKSMLIRAESKKSSASG